MMPEGPVRCDACGVTAVKRGDRWVHVDEQQAAQSPSGPHDPFKFDPTTSDWLRSVLEGGGR